MSRNPIREDQVNNYEIGNDLVDYGTFPNRQMILEHKKVIGISYIDKCTVDDIYQIESLVEQNIDSMGVFILNLSRVYLVSVSCLLLPAIYSIAQKLEEKKIRFFVIPNREDIHLLPFLFSKIYDGKYSSIFSVVNINMVLSMLSLPAIPAKTASGDIHPEFDIYYKQIQHEFSDKYQFIKTLGTGSFGFVTLIVCNKTGTKYALKVLYRNAYEDIINFINEGKLLKNTYRQNERTINCYAIDFIPLDKKRSALYQISEYQEGSLTIKSYLEQLAQLPMVETKLKRLKLMREVIIAVFDFVQYGVVHWDLKPLNILMKEEKEQFRCWIMDLGLSKEAEYAVYEKSEGTFLYVPYDEQENYIVNPYYRDIFALGVILYEIYTGCEPFHGLESNEAIIEAKRQKNIEGNVMLPDGELEFVDQLRFLLDVKLRSRPVLDILRKTLRLVDNKIATTKI